MNSKIIISFACIFALTAGCTTTNPYTGEQQTSKATSGAAIGALAGAAVGALAAGKRDRGKGALIGAGLGAATGGGIGHYMDTQEAKLREQLAGTGVSVSRNGDNITLNMPGNITFRTGSADLNTDFFKTLDSVAIVLTNYKDTLVTVAGHTDNVGPDTTNQSLSEKRASTVAGYLGGRGVASQRLSAVGFGERSPVAPNTTPNGRDQNRRVEITLNPATAN